MKEGSAEAKKPGHVAKGGQKGGQTQQGDRPMTSPRGSRAGGQANRSTIGSSATPDSAKGGPTPSDGYSDPDSAGCRPTSPDPGTAFSPVNWNQQGD